MHFNKKGDLAISTNAIVVLIIAVIMLGLIIGFVQQGFGSVSDKFFGEVEKLPEPTRASASNPITTSEMTIVRQGEEFGMKISVFNDGATDATLVKPTIKCDPDGDSTDNVIETEVVNAKDIPSKTAVTFTYIGKVLPGATVGKQLCVLTTSAGLSPAPKADVILEVRK